MLTVFGGGILAINEFIFELGLWVCASLILVGYLVSSLSPLKSIAKSLRRNK
jgi:hypothetical protein